MSTFGRLARRIALTTKLSLSSSGTDELRS
jgi:hypothetical protein